MSWKGKTAFAAGALLIGLVGAVVAQPLPDAKAYVANPAMMIDAYRRVETGGVSDAIEQLYNKRTFMSHRIHAISEGRIAGFAVTVQMDKAEGAAGGEPEPIGMAPVRAAARRAEGVLDLYA